MWAVLPRFAVHSTLSYPALMRSMEHLWRRYPALRRAALAQGFLSIAFSAFWSTLAVMLLERYHLGSARRVVLVLPEPQARWPHRWQAVWPISWAPVK